MVRLPRLGILEAPEWGLGLMKFREYLQNKSSIITIAEIGINHDGDFSTAKQLISEAKWSQSTAVKFQYRNLNNVYLGDLKEIGDEIVESEIKRNYLSPKLIMELVVFAQSLGLLAGISFFTTEDIQDFQSDLSQFNFFKIPSAEMMNFDLIDTLLNYNVEVLVSTGAHNEIQILEMLNRYKSKPIIPMHCVSNYPTKYFNSRVGYVKQLLNNWGGVVGYSSHDEDWKVAIVAISFGAQVVERHFTLSKDSIGLDHSTSSTKDEMLELNKFAQVFSDIASGEGPRFPNQGELINLQNLGRSFYARRNLAAGSELRESDFLYRAPRTGISVETFRDINGKVLTKDIREGTVLTISHINADAHIDSKSIEIANRLEVALPTRLHDFTEIHDKFGLQQYEFHLSYQEVSRLTDFHFVPKLRGFSVHLPDYVSPNQLLDPFSDNLDIRMKSAAIISNLVEVVDREQRTRGIQIPLIGSFSVGGQGPNFYRNHFDLQDRIREKGIELFFQWLPPFAWYFGGASKLYTFNDPSSASMLAKNKKKMCLDLSHFKLGVEYWGESLHDLFTDLLETSSHFHISDAAGLDGEGLAFGEGSGDIRIYLDKIMQKSGIKVIEVWQGHLNNFAGFKSAINYIGSNYG